MIERQALRDANRDAVAAVACVVDQGFGDVLIRIVGSGCGLNRESESVISTGEIDGECGGGGETTVGGGECEGIGVCLVVAEGLDGVGIGCVGVGTRCRVE